MKPRGMICVSNYFFATGLSYIFSLLNFQIMAIEPYGIGGTEVKTDAFEAFVDIPQNRVLLAEKLT